MDHDAQLTAEELLAAVPVEHRAAIGKLLDRAHQPIAPGDPRRHHFVPQFYLRRFADDMDRLGVIDLENRKHRGPPRKVSDVAVIKDFYTIRHQDGHDTTFVESVLSEIDGNASRLIALVADGVLPLTDMDRFNFSVWLGMQVVRGPWWRRSMEAMGAAMVKLQISVETTEQQVRDYLHDKYCREATDAEVQSIIDDARAGSPGLDIVVPQNEMVRQITRDGIELGGYFFARAWTILRAGSPGILTSDQPIAVYAHTPDGELTRDCGFANADEIYVPLDRRTVLLVHNAREDRTRIAHVEASDVERLNRQILEFAFAEVYGHPDDIAATRNRVLPAAKRPIGVVSGGIIEGVDMPDGINGSPERRRPRRLRQTQDAGA